jgi:hypothetical protein
MAYCPHCDDEQDGDVQWHRRCALIALGVLVIESADPHAYRYHPKE